MPGFVNCHFHSEASLGHGVYELIFERANIWMHSTFVRMREEDLHAAILNLLIAAIRGGQTGVVDMYYGNPNLPGYGADVALRAYEEIGMRVAFGLVSRDRNRYVHQDDDAFRSCLPARLADELARSPIGYAWPVDDVLATYERWSASGTVATTGSARSSPRLDPGLLRRPLRALPGARRRARTGIATHALETRSEMSFNFEHHGMAGLQRLEQLGVLGEDCSLAHFVWATDVDIELLAASGSVASNDPGSNLRLSSGIARTRDILDRGGLVGFAPTRSPSAIARTSSTSSASPACCSGGRWRSTPAASPPRPCCARPPAPAPGDPLRGPAWLADARPRRRPAHPPQGPRLLAAAALRRRRSARRDRRPRRPERPRDGDGPRRAGYARRRDHDDRREEGARALRRGRRRAPLPLRRRRAPRRLELPAEIEPYVLAFYEKWTEGPAAPGYAYNTTTGPLVRERQAGA